MKNLFFISLLSLVSFKAFSMPCDTGYTCKSDSGKYQVELGSCRYKNSLKLISIKVDGVEISEADLNKGWDADSVLAFEIALPSAHGEDLRVLSVETIKSKSSSKGLALEKITQYNPGPSTTINSESMSCSVSE